MKKVLIGFVALCALVVAALVAVPFFYSIDDLRPQIQATAEQQVRGKVELGKLSLRLFPSVQVRVDGVKVTPASAPYNTTPLVDIAGFRVELPLLSFLTGPQANVVVDTPRAVLITKGTESNITALLPAAPAGAPGDDGAPTGAAKPGASSAAASASLDETLNKLPGFISSRIRAARLSIDVREGDVALRDLEAPVKTDKMEIHHLNVLLKDIGLGAPMKIDVSVSPDVVMGDIKAGGTVKAGGTITANTQGKGLRIDLDMDKDMTGLEASMGALFRKKAGVPLSAGVKGTVVQGDTIDADFKEIEFRFGGFKTKGSLAVTNAAVPDKATMKFALKSGDTKIGPFGAVVPMITDFKLDGSFALDMSAQGLLMDPTVDVNVKLAGITGSTPQLQKPVTDLGGSISVTGSAKNPHLKIEPLSMKIASSDLAVKVETRGLAPIVASISVLSRQLNADELLGLEALKFGEPEPKAKKGAKGEAAAPAPEAPVAKKGGKEPKPAPLDETLDQLAPVIEEALANPMLDQLQANIVVDLRTVRALGADFTDVAMQMAYAKRDFRVQRMTVGAYGGRMNVTGALELDPKAMGFGFQGALTGVELGTMTRVHAPSWKDAMTGKLTGDFAIGGKGLRKAQLADKLNGSLKGDVKDGKLNLPIVKVVEMVVDMLPKAAGESAISKSKGQEYDGAFKTMKLVSAIKGRTVDLKDLDVVFDTMKAGIGEVRFKANGKVTFDQQVDLLGMAYLDPNVIKYPPLKGPSGKIELPLRMAGLMTDPKPDVSYTLKIVGPRLAKGVAIQQAGKALAPQIDKAAKKLPAPAQKKLKDLRKKFGF